MKLNPSPALLAVALLSPTAGKAGVCSDSVSGPRHDFQFFAGYSPASSTLIGSEPDRRLTIGGFTYGYRCWAPGRLSVYYNAALMPAVILRVPAQTIYRFAPPSQRRVEAHSVYGFGIAPVGLTLEYGRRALRPFIETLGGVLASTEPIPENQPNASGLNFMFDFGGGVRWMIGQRGAFAVGYKFLHVSNAGTTSFNPGVDNNVFYAGYSFLR